MKRILIFSLLAFVSSALFAQNGPGPGKGSGPENFKYKKEKMNAMKVAFITDQIDLTTEEAQRFWPIYNEMDKKVEALRMVTMEKMHALKKEGKTVDDLSDAELQKLMLERLDNDEKIAQIKKQYHEKFLKALGTKKTAKFYMAEMDFSRELMKKSKGGPGPKEADDDK